MSINITEKPAVLVERYLNLRNAKKAAETRYAEWRKSEFDEPMDQLEKQLLHILNTTGAESIRSKSGTVSKKLQTSVTTADGAEFRRHVIGAEAWDLVDWRPNKTAINDLIEAGEPLPPGVNRSTAYTISVLKGKE